MKRAQQIIDEKSAGERWAAPGSAALLPAHSRISRRKLTPRIDPLARLVQNVVSSIPFNDFFFSLSLFVALLMLLHHL